MTTTNQALSAPIRGGNVLISKGDIDLMSQPWYLSENGHVLRSDRPKGSTKQIWRHLIRDVAGRALGRPLISGEYAKPINHNCCDATRNNIGIAVGGPRSFPVPIADYLAALTPAQPEGDPQ